MIDRKLRVCWLSDFDPVGSGYQGISTKICQGLAEMGHEVKAIGLHYAGQEHNYDFSIIPIQGSQEAIVAIYNLRALWNFDVLVVALDIPLQNFILQQIQDFRSTFKYVGIMPVEADPLCMSWAMVLLQMDLPLIISKFGTEECHKANVLSAKHIQLGVDQDMWVPATLEQKKKYRKGLLNVTDDETFVVLTVADNQERKNLSAALEAFRDFSKEDLNSKYILVTRENNPVGWSLRDLIFEYGVQDKVIIMERGMPKEELQKVYATADCFLLTSKAEGLGLILTEAMSMKIPCVGTDCTGIKELLDDRRGELVQPRMVVRDPFGNGRRYWINTQLATGALQRIHRGFLPDLLSAQKHVQNMKWEDTVAFMDKELMKLMENVDEQP
jgi:glycosyltransferase involved in cell wall biosynthesis